MDVRVKSLDKRFTHFEKSLKQIAEGVFKYLDTGGRVDVYLINGSKMRKLNKEYRGKDKATDVLAVEYPKAFPQDKSIKFWGEIYLNPPYLKHKPYDIDYALVHGVLHLLGFNHKKKSDKMEMEEKEKKILLWLVNKS